MTIFEVNRIIKAEELLRRYAAGELDFAGVDIDSYATDFSNADLTEAIAIGAILRGQWFRKANLTKANLKCSVMEWSI